MQFCSEHEKKFTMRKCIRTRRRPGDANRRTDGRTIRARSSSRSGYRRDAQIHDAIKLESEFES